jgi:hypothetical protein
LSSSAAIAVIQEPNRSSFEIYPYELRKMGSECISGGERKADHLIKIAIIDITLPIDADQRTAHQRIQIFFPMGLSQKHHII